MERLHDYRQRSHGLEGGTVTLEPPQMQTEQSRMKVEEVPPRRVLIVDDSKDGALSVSAVFPQNVVALNSSTVVGCLRTPTVLVQRPGLGPSETSLGLVSVTRRKRPRGLSETVA